MKDKPMTALEAALRDYRTNPRYRAMATAVAAEIMQGIPHDLWRALETAGFLRDVNDIALKTAALMLQRIYENDYELGALKETLDKVMDAYKAPFTTLLSPKSLTPTPD